MEDDALLVQTLKHIGSRMQPGTAKRRAELRFWRQRFNASNGRLTNGHFEPLFTTVFGLTKEDYRGQRVLDIGCGPRGSLEWADEAMQRVGLDSLADDYQRELGASWHDMEYCSAGAERIPFADAHFDIVTCLDALNHVDDLGASIREIKRVTRRGGLFLLSVATDHQPTWTKPSRIDDAILAAFAPEFTAQMEFRVGNPEDHHLHRAVKARSPKHVVGQPGIYVARFLRQGRVERYPLS